MQLQNEMRRAEGMARRGGQEAAPWVEKLARVGFATKGAVYLLIGGLALMAAFNEGGQVGGGKEAVSTIGSQPFGQILLVLTGIGLLGYALWRFVQAVLDPENKGSDASGIAKRLGYAGSGFIHGALAVAAFQMASGGGSQQGGQSTYVAKLLAEPFGAFLVGAIGAFVIGAGIYQLYKAWTVKFREELKTGEMSPQEQKWAVRAGRIGLAARGIVFPMVGFFLVKAAITHNPGQARGIGGALRELGSASYGPIVLAVVAAGLMAYGIHMFVNARYRRIPA